MKIETFHLFHIFIILLNLLLVKYYFQRFHNVSFGNVYIKLSVSITGFKAFQKLNPQLYSQDVNNSIGFIQRNHINIYSNQ